MCGISGIVRFGNSKQPIAENLHRMSTQMMNRGPDGEGFLLMYRNQEKPNPFYGDDSSPEVQSNLTSKYSGKHIKEAFGISAHAGFAHRRLSIIDLSHQGHQPMCAGDRRYWIIYNGEIYNFLEIKSQLKSFGYSFSGKSDTEVLLNAYVQWGPDCLQKLNGMFAFSIWDDKEKTLFCARDRIGIKPFYYIFQDSQFIFASDIKTLIASGVYKPEPNWEGVYHAMSFGVAPRPMTSFKDVLALQQGHWMKIDPNGKATIKCYWKLPVGTQDLSMDQQTASNLLEEAIHKSVERRLVSDVPVGTFMSGGIDSTTISAIASSKHSGIKALTLAFDNQGELDELKQAKATASMHPMEHLIKYIDRKPVLKNLDDMILGYEEPFYSLSPNYVISKFASENKIKVVLNGLGGDELFGGYGHYRWLGWWQLLKIFSPLIRVLSPLFGGPGQRLKNIAATKTADRLHTTLFSQFMEHEKRKLFAPDILKEWESPEYLHEIYVGEDLKFSDEFDAMSYMDLMNYIGNHHVYRVDQFTMHFSIEGRLPLLDHELVELAFRIPTKLKFFQGAGKIILRKVAEKYIHPSCLKMRKKGFSLPVDQWMRGPLKNLVLDATVKLANRDITNNKEVEKLKSQFYDGNLNYTKLWSLVSLELWFQNFIDKGKPRSTDNLT
jgi:asparagine synthase (glutamine-hydrolysing)